MFVLVYRTSFYKDNICRFVLTNCLFVSRVFKYEKCAEKYRDTIFFEPVYQYSLITALLL